MKNNLLQNISSKTYYIIEVLTSAVITDLFIGLFNTSTYKISIENFGDYLENPDLVYPDIQIIEQRNNVVDFFILLGAFIAISFITHYILKFLVPLLVSLIDRLRYKGKNKYTRSQIVSIYHACKNNILSTLSACYNTPVPDALHFTNIVMELNKLHHIFCTSNRKNLNIIKSAFRSSNSTLRNVENHISVYDIDLLLQTMNRYFDTLCGISPVLNHDLDNAKQRIDEIQDVLYQIEEPTKDKQ